MQTLNDAISSRHALPSLRVSTWDSPSAPGRVVTLRGSMTGWESFHAIRDLVKKAFDPSPLGRPVAVNLCELEAVDPLCLSALAHAVTNALRTGIHVRLLTPPGPWAEYVIPRLLAQRPPHRVQRIAEYPAIAVDL